jgi:hypothetical protein
MDVYGIAEINHRLRCAGYKTLCLRILQDTGEDAGSSNIEIKKSRSFDQLCKCATNCYILSFKGTSFVDNYRMIQVVL